ncbi:hypothetical protein KPSB59_2510002 [Klebsiella quasipneumoniae subsp. quasipneumoniae]|nr:hypothetical protein KPSB59_2510002 [Klebsiella quasipneumoniae subsp. quasipneumoniae]
MLFIYLFQIKIKSNQKLVVPTHCVLVNKGLEMKSIIMLMKNGFIFRQKNKSNKLLKNILIKY